jgi:Na+-driven multidrug efflux pump
LTCGIGGASGFNLESGKGDHGKARHSAGTALTLLFASGVFMTVIVLAFLEPILRLCGGGASEDLMDYSLAYVGISAFGFPFLIFSIGGAHLIRADRSPKYSMACIIAGQVFNIAADWLFIYVFDWGMAGAAAASLASQFISAAMVAFYFLKLQKAGVKLRD